MKRSEQLTHLRKLSLADMKREITTLEKKLQEQKMAVSFGASKQVRTLRSLKRQLARSLTIAHHSLRQKITADSMMENSHE